jgi:hypothetical protein
MRSWVKKFAVVHSALILPPLLIACGYGLRRNRLAEQRPDLLEAFLGQFRAISCVPMALMPLTAIAIYAPTPLWGLVLPSNFVLYVIATPLGFYFFSEAEQKRQSVSPGENLRVLAVAAPVCCGP